MTAYQQQNNNTGIKIVDNIYDRITTIENGNIKAHSDGACNSQ